MAKMPRVAIAGYGYSTVGRNTGLSLDELTAQSSVAAMQDAGITAKDIDGIVIHSGLNQYVSSTHTAAMLGIPDLAFYSSSVDGAAYSVAAMHAIAAIASGSAETVLTIRTIQKQGAAMPTLDMIDPNARIDGPGQLSGPYGAGGPSWAAFYMKRHMAKYGSTEEDFGAMAIAQRKFATQNPAEAFHTDPLTMDDYMNSRYIFKPLHMLDCDYPIDSSSALIFTTE
ncbi:MAG: thiolase family protein, partial [Actinomycetota bacterium]|nr:thiolase family protein [Actinomycetota bacterium]